VIVDYTVERGNPADAPQLLPAVERVSRRAGRVPRTVTADRGYGEKQVEDDLHAAGVRTVVIPRKGKTTAERRKIEHRPAFRKTVKWRTGCEGRVSTLKRGYGLDRTRIDTTEGAKIWTGHGILTHNLIKDQRPHRLKTRFRGSVPPPRDRRPRPSRTRPNPPHRFSGRSR
jgi:IS5 family transposase